MALFQYQLTGDLESFLTSVDRAITADNVHATLEDVGLDSVGTATHAVRVYEQYTTGGRNRVSLTLSVLASDGLLSVIAATSGGPAALMVKLDVPAEEALLDTARRAVEAYPRQPRD